MRPSVGLRLCHLYCASVGVRGYVRAGVCVCVCIPVFACVCVHVASAAT